MAQPDVDLSILFPHQKSINPLQFLAPRIISIIFATATSLCSIQSWADDVSDSINEALSQYKSGDLAGASSNLEYATQLIRQQKGGQLESFLPPEPTGWQADESTSNSVGTAMFGGGTSAEKKYYHGSSSVKVSITADSPLLQSMMMLFTNPMYLQSDGGKLERMNGQKAMIKYSTQNNSGEITIVVANRYLINIKGREVTKEQLSLFPMSMDFVKLAKLP